MVGMNQMKKKLVTGIVIGAAVGVVGIGLTLWWSLTTIKSYEAGTNKKYNRLYTQDVAVLNRDVIQGEVITSDMVTTVNVHKKTVPTGALSLSEITGKVAKFNIPASIPLTSSMVTEEILSADVREQEVNTILMPSDLVSGDYVDIRIMYPNGTDYIVLAQKKVGEISGSTMWFTLTEDERLILNGAMVDSFLNEGTKLYATKYYDPQSQIKAADETDSTLRGYMLKNIADAFKLEISQEQIDSAINSTDETSTSTSTDLKTATSIYNLIIKYKNYATTLAKTTENYQPNEQIIAMMKSNANILETAKSKLSNEARQNMESALRTYKSSQSDAYNNVVTGAQAAIEEQKTQRKNLIGE